VRVLAVDDRLAERDFSHLQQQWVTTLGHGRGLEAEHHFERELAGAEVALRHRHEPVGGENFVAAAWAALLESVHEKAAVEHPTPAEFLLHQHMERRGDRRSGGAGGRAKKGLVDERFGLVAHGTVLRVVHLVHLHGGVVMLHGLRWLLLPSGLLSLRLRRRVMLVLRMRDEREKEECKKKCGLHGPLPYEFEQR
jgi:hypothetical protein